RTVLTKINKMKTLKRKKILNQILSSSGKAKRGKSKVRLGEVSKKPCPIAAPVGARQCQQIHVSKRGTIYVGKKRGRKPKADPPQPSSGAFSGHNLFQASYGLGFPVAFQRGPSGPPPPLLSPAVRPPPPPPPPPLPPPPSISQSSSPGVCGTGGKEYGRGGPVAQPQAHQQLHVQRRPIATKAMLKQGTQSAGLKFSPQPAYPTRSPSRFSETMPSPASEEASPSDSGIATDNTSTSERAEKLCQLGPRRFSFDRGSVASSSEGAALIASPSCRPGCRSAARKQRHKRKRRLMQLKRGRHRDADFAAELEEVVSKLGECRVSCRQHPPRAARDLLPSLFRLNFGGSHGQLPCMHDALSGGGGGVGGGPRSASEHRARSKKGRSASRGQKYGEQSQLSPGPGYRCLGEQYRSTFGLRYAPSTLTASNLNFGYYGRYPSQAHHYSKLSAVVTPVLPPVSLIPGVTTWSPTTGAQPHFESRRRPSWECFLVLGSVTDCIRDPVLNLPPIMCYYWRLWKKSEKMHIQTYHAFVQRLVTVTRGHPRSVSPRVNKGVFSSDTNGQHDSTAFCLLSCQFYSPTSSVIPRSRGMIEVTQNESQTVDFKTHCPWHVSCAEKAISFRPTVVSPRLSVGESVLSVPTVFANGSVKTTMPQYFCAFKTTEAPGSEYWHPVHLVQYALPEPHRQSQKSRGYRGGELSRVVKQRSPDSTESAVRTRPHSQHEKPSYQCLYCPWPLLSAEICGALSSILNRIVDLEVMQGTVQTHGPGVTPITHPYVTSPPHPYRRKYLTGKTQTGKISALPPGACSLCSSSSSLARCGGHLGSASSGAQRPERSRCDFTKTLSTKRSLDHLNRILRVKKLQRASLTGNNVKRRPGRPRKRPLRANVTFRLIERAQLRKHTLEEGWMFNVHSIMTTITHIVITRVQYYNSQHSKRSLCSEAGDGLPRHDTTFESKIRGKSQHTMPAVASKEETKSVLETTSEEPSQQLPGSPASPPLLDLTMAEDDQGRRGPRLAKKRYQTAGLYSDVYKQDTPEARIIKHKKIRAVYITGDNDHGLLPAPIHVGKYLRQKRIDFQLPYDIDWQWKHFQLLKKPDVPLYKKIRSTDVFVDMKPLSGCEPVSCSCKRPEETEDSACTEGCLNRLVYAECVQSSCPCGELCTNRRFQRQERSAGLERFRTTDRGWGVRTTHHFQANDLIIEYLGEVLSEANFRAFAPRSRMLAQRGEQAGMYCVQLDSGVVIDSYRMGNEARFINHSCQPNCEMQKWCVSVNGIYRIGLFALKDIPISTELTYDYNFHTFTAESQRPCLCGSPNCRNVIGGRSQR
uniref:Uncharacterized protein n=1 Tax=Petromyzon marinus TaxID=7757 RepID=S4RJQ8_PETMA